MEKLSTKMEFNFRRYRIFFNLAKTVWEPEAQFLWETWIIVLEKYILVWNECRVFDSFQLQRWIMILFSSVTFLLHLPTEMLSVFWNTLKSELRLKQSTLLLLFFFSLINAVIFFFKDELLFHSNFSRNLNTNKRFNSQYHGWWIIDE